MVIKFFFKFRKKTNKLKIFQNFKIQIVVDGKRLTTAYYGGSFFKDSCNHSTIQLQAHEKCIKTIVNSWYCPICKKLVDR